MSKKLLLILFCLLFFSTRILAENQPISQFDSQGNLVQFWLDGFDLKQLDVNNPRGITLLSFTREVESFGIKHANFDYFLVFKYKSENFNEPLLYSFSNNNGQSFSPPIALITPGTNPGIASSNNLVAMVWEDNHRLVILQSPDRGRNFSPPLYINITGEVLSSPVLSFDENHDLDLCFVSRNPQNFLSKIIYAKISCQLPIPALLLEPKTIASSQDEIDHLLIKHFPHPIIFWQENYNHRLRSFLSVSLDNGNNFSPARSFNCEQRLEDFAFFNRSYWLLTFNQKPQIKEIKFPDLYAPKILLPSARKAYNSSTFLIKYLYPDYQRDWNSPSQLFSEIDLSADNNFSPYSTQSYRELILATPEALSYSPPKLADGNYYLRISVFDGLNTSSDSSIIPFTIDNLLPALVTLEAETAFNQITFKGQTNKSSIVLTVNGYKAAIQASKKFQLQAAMLGGRNRFTFVLTDEAGNQNVITHEAYFNPQAPIIQMLQPTTHQWFKPGSTIFFEANVTDVQNDIDDETEARLSINSQFLPDPLIYSLQDNKLTGFIALPPILQNGQYPAKIEIADHLGNKTSVDFMINIDGSPPMVLPSQSHQLYGNTTKNLALPVTDSGAGMDVGGTLIKIGGVSFEGSVSAESDRLNVLFKSLLTEGSYEVQVLPRDRVGNLGAVQTFSLIIDNAPPLLILEGSLESITQLSSLTIRGRVEDRYPGTLNIYDNNNKVASLNLSGPYFSKEIRLLPGNNYFLVEAVDLAGNKSSQTFSINAQITGHVLLRDCINGPNPFSPLQKEIMYFTYTLNGPIADPVNVKILVYDLSGRLIWNKEILNAPISNNVAWDGKDLFGKQLVNGVYPYFITISSGNQRELRRGKIVVLN